MKKLLIGLFTLLLASVAFAANMPTAASHVSIKAPMVDLANMSAMGQKVTNKKPYSTEVRMDIMNNSKKAIRIVAATSDAASQIQLHRFKKEDGKMIMRQISHIKVKPHHDKMLSYKGIHLMLIGLKKPLKANEVVPITLIFADGSYKQVNAKVS